MTGLQTIFLVLSPTIPHPSPVLVMLFHPFCSEDILLPLRASSLNPTLP